MRVQMCVCVCVVQHSVVQDRESTGAYPAHVGVERERETDREKSSLLKRGTEHL